MKAYHGIGAVIDNVPTTPIIQRAITTRKEGLTSFSRKMKFIKDTIVSIPKAIKAEAGRLLIIVAAPKEVIPQMEHAKLRTKTAVWFEV